MDANQICNTLKKDISLSLNLKDARALFKRRNNNTQTLPAREEHEQVIKRASIFVCVCGSLFSIVEARLIIFLRASLALLILKPPRPRFV